jgi:hypothetical protein
MNQNSPPPDDSWESDAVWKLLDQAPPAQASKRFAADTARAARLENPVPAWWERLLSPAPLTGLATCAAAVALAFVAWTTVPPSPEISSKLAETSHAAEIQEIAETETLIAALDQLDDFSDHELVSLIGF